MLPRVLRSFDYSVLASAAMGPAYSLAVTMGPMVAVAGRAAPLALALLSGIMLCVAIAFARLGAIAPSAGSSYTWIGGAFGPRAGAYAAWLLLLSNYFATVTTALPAATYTLDLVAPALAPSPLWNALVATVWIAASAVLLYLGLRPTALLTAGFLIAELLVVGASAVAALVVRPSPEGVVAPLVLPNPGLGIVTAMVLGIWMIDGWEVSAAASEESAGSRTSAGTGGIVGLLVTAAVLLAAMGAYLRVGSVAGFAAHSNDAMAYVAARLGGPLWRVALVSTVLVSTAATLWTTMLYLSRSAYAMGRTGVLPRPLGTLDARGLPGNALWSVAASVAVCTLVTGLWPTAASALALVLSGTAVFLGALFCLSAAAAVKRLSQRGRHRDRRGAAIAAFGGAALAAVVAIDVAQSDALTRGIELGGLAAGIPLCVWRRSSRDDRQVRDAFEGEPAESARA